MPKTLAVLKVCWALLAWILFASGVIGCSSGPDTARDATDTDASADGLADGPRPKFVSYVETTSYYDVTLNQSLTSTGLSIDAAGRVCGGQATASELATFVEVATRPSTIAAFLLTTSCSPVADGSFDVSLTLDDYGPLKRSVNCDGVAPLRQAAMVLQDAVCARVHGDAGAPAR